MTARLQGRKILVFGGGGFLGKHVVRKLIRASANVRVFDISPNVDAIDVEWMVGSIEDKDNVVRAAMGFDTVVQLAAFGIPATGNIDLTREIKRHVVACVEVAEICQQQGVGRLIFASSGGTVYGSDSPMPIMESCVCEPRNAYGVSKLAIEHYLRLLSLFRGMKTLSLRISNPYGPGQVARGQGFIAEAMARLLANSPMSVWGDGSVVRDFIFVEDVAEAMARACCYDGAFSTINIGSGVGTSLLEVHKVIEQVTERKLRLDLEPSRIIDVKANVLDVRLAGRELHWFPVTTLNSGIEKTWRWWRDR